MSGANYVFGHGAREVRRLELQAAALRPGTERILRAVDLRPGSSVLDVGTGTGDVALVAAELVGPSGSVLGIDQEASVLEHARDRAGAAGHEHVRYLATTLDGLPDDARFDAVVMRYVVCHQPDRAAFLRQAAARVRRGGRLVVMEPGGPDLEGPDRRAHEWWSRPRVALFEEVRDLVIVAFDLAGVRFQIGRELVPLFHEAGLPEPAILQDVPVGGATSSIVELFSLLLESLLPVLQRHGVTDAERIGMETLPARLEAAVGAVHAQVRLYDLMGGWVTLGATEAD